jgi:hypothetical protein
MAIASSAKVFSGQLKESTQVKDCVIKNPELQILHREASMHAEQLLMIEHF